VYIIGQHSYFSQVPAKNKNNHRTEGNFSVNLGFGTDRQGCGRI